MVYRGTRSSYRSFDCIGLWSCLVYISASSEHLYIFDLHGAIYAVNFFGYIFLYLLVTWAWWGWPLTWLTDHHPSVRWPCCLGHATRKIVSEMTYNVSSLTLNRTVPFHTQSSTHPRLRLIYFDDGDDDMNFVTSFLECSLLSHN